MDHPTIEIRIPEEMIAATLPRVPSRRKQDRQMSIAEVIIDAIHAMELRRGCAKTQEMEALL